MKTAHNHQSTRQTNREFLIFACIMLAVTVSVYWKYLFGGQYFISQHGDSIYQAVPIFLDRARTIWRAGLTSNYNFHIAFGSIQGALDPMNTLLVMCGEEAIPHMMGVFQVLKVFFCGIFFYAYGRKVKFSFGASVLIALGYALCGPMMNRSGLISYPNEYLFVAASLLSVELLLQDHNYALYPLAMGLLFWSTEALRVLIYTMLFLAYTIFRYCMETDVFDAKAMLKDVGRVFSMTLVGLGLVAIFVLPNYAVWMRSSRLEMKAGRSLLADGIMNPNITMGAVLSTLTANPYIPLSSSLRSYLAGPSMFVGIANLLMIPQLVVCSSKKERLGYGFCVMMILAYFILIPLRKLASGFDDSFKLSSFWIIILFLYMAGKSWTRFFRDHVLSVPLLLCCAGGVLVLITKMRSFCSPYYFIPVQETMLTAGGIILSAAAILLYHYHGKLGRPKWMSQRICAAFLLAVLAADMIGNAYISQNRLVGMSRQEYRQSANATGMKELALTFKEDANDHFRITNTSVVERVALCDALANDYLSTAAYHGGNGVLESNYSLANLVSGDQMPPDYGYRPILQNNYLSMRALNALTGVRYIVSEKALTQAQPYTPFGTVLIENDDWWILENNNALPLAFFYDSVILKSDVLPMEQVERREVLLQSALVPDDSPLAETLPVETRLQWDLLARLEQAALPVKTERITDEATGNNGMLIHLQAPAIGKYLICFADVAHCVSPEKYQMEKWISVQWAGEDGVFSQANTMQHHFAMGDDQLLFDIPAAGVRYIRILCDDNCDIEQLRSISSVDESFFAPFLQNLEERKEDAFHYTRLENNHIEGTAQLYEQKLLCLPFAYDGGWTATVNGEPAEVHLIDESFMGILLPPGESSVKLVWRDPGKTVFTAINVAAILLYLGVVLYERRRAEHGQATRPIAPGDRVK